MARILLPGLLLAGCAGLTSPGAGADRHRIAAVQYEIRGSQSAESILQRASAHVESAVRGGAELVVFPELFVLDAWPLESEDDEAVLVRRIAKEITPVVQAGLRRAARERRVAILAGSAPEVRGERLFNTARLFFADGREITQDKMMPTAWGRRVGMTPGRELEVFDGAWGKTVIMVCYDVESPQLSAELSKKAPEVILVPSMTESESGRYRVRWTAQARAVEHHAYVVIAPTVGRTSPDWAHFGRAAFLTPREAGFPGVLAEASSETPGPTWATLDLGALRESRRRTEFHPARDGTR